MGDKFKIGHTAATLKSGYLVKFSKSTGTKNARKRYVVLNGNAIIYYADHNSLNTPKGNLLIVGDSEVIDKQLEGFEFAFEVATPFESLVLAARSAEDRAAWKYSISKAIEFARFSLRGYMIKKGTFLEGSPRKFFVLHNNRLSFHADHEHTALTQWSIDISDKTIMKVIDDKKMILGVSDGIESVVIQFEARNAADYTVWKEALAENIAKFCELKAAEMTEVENILESAGLNGQMDVRAADGSDVWTEHLVALTDTTLYVIESYEDGNFFRVTDSFVFQSDSNVVATTLKDASFEVVTAEKIVQLNAETREEADYWMEAIRDVIKSTVRVETDPNDSLYFHAQLKIPLDNFYEATFNEAKPLGVVLVKAGEWAFAKVANYKETGVKVGSALYSINGEPVWNMQYADVVDRLKGWYPPLALGFRQAPEKSGYLLKKSTTKNNTVWKKKYFVMEEGKLYFKNGEGASYGKRGEIALFGAAISLVKTEDLDQGHFYCFRVLSGLVSYTLEARDLEDMREWTAMIYHAIAFANGGAYIVAHDLELVMEEEERLRAMAIQEEIEREKTDQARAELFSRMKYAVEERSLDDLEESLKLAEECEMAGDFVEYAKRLLVTLHQEEERRVEDEKMEEAAAAFEEEQMRLEGEMQELAVEDAEEDAVTAGDGQLTPGGGSARQSSLRLRQSLAAGGAGAGTDARLEKMTAAMAAIGEEEEEEDDDEDFRAMSGGKGAGQHSKEAAQEAFQEPEDLTPPAGPNDLKKFFGFYVKKTGETGEAYINVMQFSAIWRVVTEEKGNLFKEMKMFNKFDVSGSGTMNESDFIAGWLNYATETHDEKLLKKITNLLGEDNMLL